MENNYITRLQRENESMRLHIGNTKNAINAFRAFLTSAKFQGDGNQWIATADVERAMQDVLNWMHED